MKYAVITSCDAKYGDFLINHWLKSLTSSTPMDDIEVVVLDYGLMPEQRVVLQQQKVRVIPCVRDGHVVVIRLRDAAAVLSKEKYRQVLICDGGDIVFQDDVHELFNTHPTELRAVYERVTIPFEMFNFSRGFSAKNRKKITTSLQGRKVINGGLLVGPRKKIVDVLKASFAMIRDLDHFGPDQIAIDYQLHERGFTPLDDSFNYVLVTARMKNYYIRDGIFYMSNGRKISVVHNAGQWKFMRVIAEFGHGPRRNKVRKVRRIMHMVGQEVFEFYAKITGRVN